MYPPRCPVCDRAVNPAERICRKCVDRLVPLVQPWCMRCGKKLMSEEEYCEDCKRISHNFDRGRALYEYESVALSIYRMKYGGRQEYAEYFGRAMAKYLGPFIRMVGPQALIPVPLHPARMRKRGYNQSALLAKTVGKELDIPVAENLISRVRNTQPLKRQNPIERQNNLKKAFIINQNDVKLKLNTTIIVDDIYTTGSTVDEITTVLKAGGVKRVYVVTLACGAGV